MGRGILRGAGGDENLKFNFIWPIHALRLFIVIRRASRFIYASCFILLLVPMLHVLIMFFLLSILLCVPCFCRNHALSICSLFQLVFEATLTGGYLGDIAIDDISVKDGKCDSKTVTPVSVKSSVTSDRSAQLRRLQKFKKFRKMLRRRRNMSNWWQKHV